MEQDEPRHERRRAILLFFATLASVFLVYGFQWAGGNPLTDARVAGESARFAVALMSILLAHEMGHYLVALRHGFRLSLPYFLPFPAAFGTFGAIIRLRSLPSNRTALLEMGAAGPLAGFVVAMVVMALGLPDTRAMSLADVVASLPPLPPLTELPPPPEPGALDRLLELPVFSRLFPLSPPGTIPLMILANPPAMDLLGELILGAPPGRYDTLGPLSMAGWVGCLLTGINLLPIGQLDGGHIANALAPRFAPVLSKIGVGVALLAGLMWGGWIVWGVMLLALRAWVSLPVPQWPPLSPRARVMAALGLVAFLLSFMPRPVQIEDVVVPVPAAAGAPPGEAVGDGVSP